MFTPLTTMDGGYLLRASRLTLFEYRDREWQKWPITIVTGAYLGYAVGKVLGGYVFRGARIKMM